MKKLFLFTFAFCIMHFAFPQQYAWKDISANIPTQSDLSDVFFVSDDEGWITSSSHAEIYHTIDGGETFEIQTTQLSTEAIHMLNENEGYCGGASGFIYRTTDGGINWNFHGTIGATLADISFPPSGGTGYACGLNGAISSITSSAVTPMSSGVNETLTSITFPVTSDEGWVCFGSIIRHYTGGTWAGDQDYPSGGYNAIHFVDNNNGWAVGDAGIIIHTTDGINWAAQTNPDTQNRTLRGVFFLNTQEGWAVGSTGVILHTSNGGNTWAVEGSGLTSSSLRKVHFVSTINDNVGYIVGNGKTLLKYTEISGVGDYFDEVDFEMFPNPSKNSIQIKSSDFKTESGTIEVLSMDGKKILEMEITKGTENIDIDLSDLEPGMYLCKITIDNRSSTKKIIAE